MAVKKLKDWSEQLAELSSYGYETVNALYADMLATAHDIGYKVPDHELIETENPEDLKRVIPPLHEGLVAFHGALIAEEKNKKSAAKAPSKKEKEKAPTKPVAKTEQKESKSKETTMAATAKKTKTAPAKKVAKKTAKKGGKPNANARQAAGGGVGRYTGDEKITVKIKTNPAREGSGRFDRIARIMKFNGKTVKDFVKAGGATASLHFSEAQGWISVK